MPNFFSRKLETRATQECFAYKKNTDNYVEKGRDTIKLVESFWEAWYS